jgi:hypothetical protein
MKVLLTLTIGILASTLLTMRATVSRGHATPAAATIQRSASSHLPSYGGTVVVIHQNGSATSVITRDGSGQLAHITLGSNSKVTSADGRSLAQTSVRLGDHLAVRSNGQIEDLSQRTEDLQALVSVAPAPYEGPMVVVRHHSQDIAVDLTSRTHYADRSHETSSAVGIVDGDLVRVHGVVDEALGEMTQTDTVSRLGPVLSRIRGHRASTG